MNGWRQTTLGEISTFAGGYSFPPAEQTGESGDIPFIKVSDMNLPGNEIRIRESTNSVSESTLKKLKARAWPEGTVVFPKVGAALMTEKRRILTRPTAFDNNIMGLVPREGVHPYFLFLLMCHTKLAEVAQMGAVPSVNQGNVASVPVALPSPAEQRRIADLMSKLDAHIAAMTTAAGASWSLHSALRTALLSDAPRVPLSTVCTLRARLVDPRHPDYAQLPHVGVESIEKGTGRVLPVRSASEDNLVSNKYLFANGDVIYSKIRPALRKVAAPDFAGLCSADAYPLTPAEGIPSSLLREALLDERVVEEVVGMSGRTKMPKVNRKELFSILVPMPDADRAQVDRALSTQRLEAEQLDAESRSLSELRSTMLTSLLTQDVTLTPTYDPVIGEVA